MRRLFVILAVLPLALCTSLKVLSWNVNSDRRCSTGFAKDSHAAWNFDIRLPRISALISKADADIVALQECDHLSVQSMEDFLTNLGYKCIVASYCDHPLAFRFITAFKPSRFEAVKHQMRYMNVDTLAPTPRPDNFNQLPVEQKRAFARNNLGEEFERSVLEVALMDLQSGRMVYTFNNHFGLRKEYRLESARLLSGFIKDFTGAGKEDGVTLVMGDFNAFPDEPESTLQMSTIKEGAELEDLAMSRPLTYYSGTESGEADFESTFNFYPYDFGKISQRANALVQEVMGKIYAEEDVDARRQLINGFFKDNVGPSVLGGKLDFILGSGMRNIRSYQIIIDPVLDEPVSLLQGGQRFEAQTIKDFVLELAERKIVAFPSDHFPNVVVLEV